MYFLHVKPLRGKNTMVDTFSTKPFSLYLVEVIGFAISLSK